MNRNTTRRAIRILSSPAFFWGVLAFFILESLWLVFSAVYPMAFDEGLHFGIIKIYSHHWLPFLSGQPAGADQYGAVARDPSYLYHYLMSFPYRLIALFTKDQTIQVIWLRLINVGLFTYALILLRRFLLHTKVSRALTNVCLLLFVLIPIVPLLAAEINYDNLTMVLVAWMCLLVERILAAIKKRNIALRDISLLIILCLLGSIVKYAVLPMAAACVVILLAAVSFGFGNDFKDIWRAVLKNYRTIGMLTKVYLVVLFVVSLGLFSQRYLLNFVAYKTPFPRCDRVLSVDECMSYSSWARGYTDMQDKSSDFKPHILNYAQIWSYGMWYRLFFGVNGNVEQPAWARYETFAPMPLPSWTAVVIFAVSTVLVVRWWRKLFWDNWLFCFVLLMGALYIAALFIDNFSSYAHTGQPVAINGRYLLPVLLPLIAIAARAWELTLRKRETTKVFVGGFVILLFLQGGGVLTFMVDGNYTWYWPDSHVQAANKMAHDVAHKIILRDQPMYIHTP
jgi:hypothetical protein